MLRFLDPLAGGGAPPPVDIDEEPEDGGFGENDDSAEHRGFSAFCTADELIPRDSRE